MIFVNFKAYQQGIGEAAVKMAEILEDVAHETQIKIIPVVGSGDIREVTSATILEVWAQKIDPFEPGAHTGSILAETVIEDGAAGTFLNHSESRLASYEELAKASDRAKLVGLKTLIFAKDIEDLKNVSSLTPNYVAYEPPELIGSSEVSVATAKPEVIKEAAEIARLAGIPLIVGAGVHSAEDVRKSMELGAAGIAIASDIMKAENPKKELLDLTEGFK